MSIKTGGERAMKKSRKIMATMLSAMMGLSMLSGCGGSGAGTTTKAAAAATKAAAATTKAAAATTKAAAATTKAAAGTTTKAAASNDKPYAGTTLTYWVPLHANVSASVSNLGDTNWAKEVEKQTGITIKFTHPTSNNIDEGFNVMTASGEYPDIIEYTWTKYPGGTSAAVKDGLIIKLNDIFKSDAPNMKKILDEHKDIDKMIKTSDGDYYCFPFLRGLTTPNKTLFSGGIVIRKDLLDKTGLAMPETIDDWDKVLRTFKQSGVEVPFTTRKEWMKDVWSPGFDNWGDFYVDDDGKVKNGLIEDSRKAFLTKMNQWYADGLIDRDYLVADKASNQTFFTSGKSAAV
jgi:putative aldouronate transport system substrate-binding protein